MDLVENILSDCGWTGLIEILTDALVEIKLKEMDREQMENCSYGKTDQIPLESPRD